MSAELLINVTPSESRVALIENGILQEIHVERHTKRGLVGNIYRGKVSRVHPHRGAREPSKGIVAVLGERDRRDPVVLEAALL